MTERFCRFQDMDLRSLMLLRLPHKRYMHSLAVARRAWELAMRNKEGGERAYFAGLIHDLCKCLPMDEQLHWARSGDIIPDEEDLSVEGVVHQYAAAEFAALELKVTDEEILDAVRWHSTGRANMSTLGKIIYLADLSSHDREFPDLEEIREISNRSLDEGMAYCVKRRCEHLLEKGEKLLPKQKECFMAYVGEDDVS